MARRRIKAEVTLFMSLLLLLLMGFISALIMSSKVAASKSYERGALDLATESVFGEYHTTLLEEFHIFALDATYETGTYDVENIRNRLVFYGAGDMEWEITQLQLLSDCNGAAYEEQILTYMKEQYGIDQLTSVFGDTDTWETQRVEGEDATANSEEIILELEQEVEEAEGELSTEDNPLENLESIKSSGILSLVVDNTGALSSETVQTPSLPSNRTLETGYASYELTEEYAYMNKVLVSEYVLEHFTCATDTLGNDENTDGEYSGLQYEIEYILEGGDSDQENLEGIVNQLIMIRTGVNYACLQQSTVKKAEVSALATTIATASAMPFLSGVIEQALLLGWAYGESIMDVRSLLSGKRVVLIKTEEDWQLDLSSLMDLGGEDDIQEGADMESGLCYEDYLKILLYLESKDSMVIRSLDMVEHRMKTACGLTYFRVDQCITQIAFQNTSQIYGGYTYEFPVSFTYR